MFSGCKDNIFPVNVPNRANYKNAVKGIDYTPVYLERFFRNLLLGEEWELRNRYLHIRTSEQIPEQVPEQVQDKYRASTGQVENMFYTDNINIQNLVTAIGEKEMSVKTIILVDTQRPWPA